MLMENSRFVKALSSAQLVCTANNSGAREHLLQHHCSRRSVEIYAVVVKSRLRTLPFEKILAIIYRIQWTLFTYSIRKTTLLVHGIPHSLLKHYLPFPWQIIILTTSKDKFFMKDAKGLMLRPFGTEAQHDKFI